MQTAAHIGGGLGHFWLNKGVCRLQREMLFIHPSSHTAYPVLSVRPAKETAKEQQ